jgi:iron complex outermembrane receptor protein
MFNMTGQRFLLALLFPGALFAQDTTHALQSVRVTATREGPRSPLVLPYGVSQVRPDSLAALRRAGVDELLFAIPGVSLANRQNPAQDPRVSIRGFGARSAFGVRGVRVLQDGVPVTLPDGQTPVDVLNLEGADRVEAIRGSASSLYGNAAGGVIDVRSAPPATALSPFARVVGGGSTPLTTATGISGSADGIGMTSSVTRNEGHGFRDYSDQRSVRGAFRALFGGDDNGRPPITLAARVTDVSLANSPGALTRAQFDDNPRQADALSVRKGASKKVQQGDLSLVLAQALGDAANIDLTAFGSARTLENPTTQAYIDVKRASGGASLHLDGRTTAGGHTVRFAAGADAQWLNDDRQEYDNCIGTGCTGFTTDRGALRKNQRELVSSVGPYARSEFALSDALLASAGVRADKIHFQLRDRLITSTNPDDSGERTLDAVSPSAGIVWRATPLASVYANVSSSFETPTTTELGNKIDGTSGINPDLQPQRTLSVEIGTKGFFSGTPLRWDLAAFEAHAHDELVPFDIPSGNGRRFFRNAGRTVRRGGEIGLDADLGRLTLRSAYTYSHFRYVDYAVGATSYAGRRIPGVPEQALMTSASFHVSGAVIEGTADLASAMDVDDANSAQAPGRTLFGIAVSKEVVMSGVRFAPLVAVQNLAGVNTVGSVSVNATAGKFYEPAPGRLLLVRVALARAAAP